jgi:hypothetical protein
MHRSSKGSTLKLSSDSQQLVALAEAVMQAASRIEERAWEHRLDALLCTLLKNRHQNAIDAAFEYAFKTQSIGYDALMDSAEALSESCVIEHEGRKYDALLIAAPILAWTRFAISSGTIAPDLVSGLATQLSSHILADGVCLAIAPTLFAIDQLPRSHAETFALTHRLARAALDGVEVRPPANPPETVPFLADTRYILAVAVVEQGTSIFRWQMSEKPGDCDNALLQWKAQALPHITRLLPGCGVELLLPTAYFAACREGDAKIRPISLRAAVHYLTHTLTIDANSLRATIGGFGGDSSSGQIDEYRIGFSLAASQDVVYGVVWPLYGQENEDRPLVSMPLQIGAIPPDATDEMLSKTPLEQIVALLRECGIAHVKRHPGCFPIEVCEDCGTPLYLDMEGELAHPEMPEEAQQTAVHLH